MAKGRFQQMIERAGGIKQSTEAVAPTKNSKDLSPQANVQQPKSKNKLIVGVAIGVGVISVVALIFLLRKK